MLPPRTLLLGMTLLAVTLGVSPAAAPASEAGDSGVRRIEALVGEAHFREAAERAPALRRALLAMPPGSGSRKLLVRTELAAGTAALALGQESAAKSCFLRALQLEPSLVLGAKTPPKVRSAVDSLREVRD